MNMHVQEFGLDQTDSIVFIHGGGLSGWMWNRQVEDLCDFHCLVPDLPEQGRSISVKPFSIQDSAKQIAELIESRAHGGKAHVVGHSIGAQIVVQLLATSPQVVDHAIVNSALVRRIPGMISLIKPTVQLTIPLTRAKWFAKLQAKALSVPHVDFDEYFNDSKSMTGEALEHVLMENTKFSVPKGLESCTIPTLMLVGQKERGIMRNSMKDLLSVIPNSKGYMVQGVGHSFNFEDPSLYNQIVRSWLTDKRLPTERLKAV